MLQNDLKNEIYFSNASPDFYIYFCESSVKIIVSDFFVRGRRSRG